MAGGGHDGACAPASAGVNGCALEVRAMEGRAGRRALRAMSAWHYRPGGVRGLAGVWGAWAGDDLAGVLAVAYPTLNEPTLALAWPDVPSGNSRERAAWINANVRVIARVIVEPRWRGSGVARALVRAYVRSPLTQRTIARAAMGRVSSFFEAGGMRALTCEPARRDVVFARRLGEHGVAAWELLDVLGARALLRERAGLREAVVAWARASKATARHVSEHEERACELAALAASRALSPAMVYVWP